MYYSHGPFPRCFFANRTQRRGQSYSEDRILFYTVVELHLLHLTFVTEYFKDLRIPPIRPLRSKKKNKILRLKTQKPSTQVCIFILTCGLKVIFTKRIIKLDISIFLGNKILDQRDLVSFETATTMPYIITSFACKSITRLQLYSLRAKTLMTGRIWKAKVTAAPIQLRTTSGSYKAQGRGILLIIIVLRIQLIYVQFSSLFKFDWVEPCCC